MNKGTYITNKREIKIMKATILFDILEYCLDKNISLIKYCFFHLLMGFIHFMDIKIDRPFKFIIQIIMFNYPMH